LVETTIQEREREKDRERVRGGRRERDWETREKGLLDGMYRKKKEKNNNIYRSTEKDL